LSSSGKLDAIFSKQENLSEHSPVTHHLALVKIENLKYNLRKIIVKNLFPQFFHG
jgi:bifunctional DNase/RNase